MACDTLLETAMEMYDLEHHEIIHEELLETRVRRQCCRQFVPRIVYDTITELEASACACRGLAGRKGGGGPTDSQLGEFSKLTCPRESAECLAIRAGKDFAASEVPYSFE